MSLDRRNAQTGERLDHRAEPIAILGMACRFPGADGLEAFWALQRDGVDATADVPADRWDGERYHDPYLSQPGKIVTQRGGFVADLAGFDAAFFSIPDGEATMMDPQHRLLLEAGWHAIEDAAQAPDALRGSACGVFIGISGSEFAHACLASPRQVNAYTAMGNAPSVAVNRLSRLFGFTGPSLGVDSGCSSALVAVHLACQSLSSGECTIAFAGGVNALLGAEISVALSQAWMLSPDGCCRSFDASGDGYARSEGCGVVVLKRLSDALRDGDPVRAVILGTAVAHRGSAVSASEAARSTAAAAVAAAGIEPEALGYVEAHGVGAALADGDELAGLAALLARKESGAPCVIGSIKSNIGNLESAAGMAGLIRTVQVLEHEFIPALLHLRTPNSAIDWTAGNLELAQERQPWPRGSTQRVAGVNSFGLGGTYAHVLVADAPPQPLASRAVSKQVLFLSAKSRDALRAMAGRYASFLRSHPQVRWADVCHTAATARARFAHCASFTAIDADEAVLALERFRDTGEGEPVSEPLSTSGRRIALPVYPFQRKRFWPRAEPIEDAIELRRLSSMALSVPVYEAILDPALPSISGHRVHGVPVAAGPLLAALMLDAAQAEMGPCSLNGLEFLCPLRFESPARRAVQCILEKQEAGATACRVYSSDVDLRSDWTLHAQARIGEPVPRGAFDRSPGDDQSLKKLDGTDFYAACAAAGIELAPTERVTLEIERAVNEPRCRSRLAAQPRKITYGQIASRALQAAVELLAAAARHPAGSPWVPVSVEAVHLVPDAALVDGHGVVLEERGNELMGNVFFADANGATCAEVRGLRLHAAPLESFARPQTAAAHGVVDAALEEFALTLEAAQPDQRAGLLVAWLQAQIDSLLGPERARAGSRTAFFDLGMDSLMLMELRNRLQQALGGRANLPIAVLFNYPTVEALAAKIAADRWEDSQLAGYDPLEAEVAQLSNLDLDRSLEAFEEWSQAEDGLNGRDYARQQSHR